MMTGKLLLFFVPIILFGMSLTGCMEEDTPRLHEENSHNLPREKEEAVPVEPKEDPVPPAEMEGEFYKVQGWLDNRNILYITNVNGGSNLYQYELFDGKSTLLYESPHFIVTAELNPGKDMVMIHSAPSSYEAELTIIDMEGETVFETRLPSFELAFEWNMENQEKILVSAFKEDWSYQVYIMDIGNKDITEVDLEHPFAVWPAEEEIYYLDWENNGPSLHAPLNKRSLDTRAEQTVLPGIHHLDISGADIFAVQSKETDPDRAVYYFIDSESGDMRSFEVAQLSAYSGWLVPFNDINEDRNFFYFRPLYSGEADLYGEGFTLSRYSLDEGSVEDLMEGMENEPLDCAPEGTYCLYGYQLEKLIDLQEKQILDLVDTNN
jgi:hypothetical protein